MAENLKDGLILVDKPKGITSFDVIRILRRKLGVKKMGHAGTLDPAATGLLIVALGSKTKELKNLIGLPKVYIAEILFGTKTDTGDLDGKIIEDKKAVCPARGNVKQVLKNMEGEILLPAPLYSAIKKEGKPLYKYARAGEKIDPPIKKMKIISAELISCHSREGGNPDLNCINDICSAEIKFNVGSGTYIRSLAEELALRLGTIATLKNLRRISVGHFSVSDAMKLI